MCFDEGVDSLSYKEITLSKSGINSIKTSLTIEKYADIVKRLTRIPNTFSQQTKDILFV